MKVETKAAISAIITILIMMSVIILVNFGFGKIVIGTVMFLVTTMGLYLFFLNLFNERD
jgi:hypothetical protein